MTYIQPDGLRMNETELIRSGFRASTPELSLQMSATFLGYFRGFSKSLAQTK
jgi:hypothetical protein